MSVQFVSDMLRVFQRLSLLLMWRYRSSLDLLNNTLPLKAVLYLFCPLHKLHLLQVILDIVFPTGLRLSCWSTCEWFPFVYSFFFFTMLVSGILFVCPNQLNL